MALKPSRTPAWRRGLGRRQKYATCACDCMVRVAEARGESQLMFAALRPQAVAKPEQEVTTCNKASLNLEALVGFSCSGTSCVAHHAASSALFYAAGSTVVLYDLSTRSQVAYFHSKTGKLLACVASSRCVQWPAPAHQPARRAAVTQTSLPPMKVWQVCGGGRARQQPQRACVRGGHWTVCGEPGQGPQVRHCFALLLPRW